MLRVVVVFSLFLRLPVQTKTVKYFCLGACWEKSNNLGSLQKKLTSIRKGIYSFVIFEISAAAVGFAAFRTLRRSEEKRKYLYLNWPNVSASYYWLEDSVSFGQLTGTRLRLTDQRRWAQIETENNIESD